mmetsp:Transcript_8470/g.25390  ORF Transcript_8470/g.25390 Transcript_8470/m.25390 type:complete len:205 (+) Transcript_8470:137-751(+)
MSALPEAPHSVLQTTELTNGQSASQAESNHTENVLSSAEEPRNQLLTVIRHGKRLDEVEALWRSTAERPWDPPLWDDGLAAVEAMAQELTRYNFQRLVVSPFQRCIRTAQLLNTVLQLPFSSWQIDPAVCEILNPKLLVGAQLSPPVGNAEDWMWGGRSLQSALEATLGRHASEITTADSKFPPFPETAEEAHARYAMAFEVRH